MNLINLLINYIRFFIFMTTFKYNLFFYFETKLN